MQRIIMVWKSSIRVEPPRYIILVYICNGFKWTSLYIIPVKDFSAFIQHTTFLT